jgi:hypothetical protein
MVAMRGCPWTRRRALGAPFEAVPAEVAGMIAGSQVTLKGRNGRALRHGAFVSGYTCDGVLCAWVEFDDPVGLVGIEWSDLEPRLRN